MGIPITAIFRRGISLGERVFPIDSHEQRGT
jgi:hypothetical protein